MSGVKVFANFFPLYSQLFYYKIRISIKENQNLYVNKDLVDNFFLKRIC